MQKNMILLLTIALFYTNFNRKSYVRLCYLANHNTKATIRSAYFEVEQFKLKPKRSAATFIRRNLLGFLLGPSSVPLSKQSLFCSLLFLMTVLSSVQGSKKSWCYSYWLEAYCPVPISRNVSLFSNNSRQLSY